MGVIAQLEAGIAGRDWVIAGAIATIVLLVFVIPLTDKLRSVIGGTSKPFIEAHDQSADAHMRAFTEVNRAISLIRQAQENLQRQIDAGERNTSASLESMQRQLEMAIELLERD